MGLSIMEAATFLRNRSRKTGEVAPLRMSLGSLFWNIITRFISGDRKSQIKSLSFDCVFRSHRKKLAPT